MRCTRIYNVGQVPIEREENTFALPSLPSSSFAFISKINIALLCRFLLVVVAKLIGAFVDHYHACIRAAHEFH